ncbi:hypothetical protein F4808DRAFT_417404 [Astrocystis sublimbata]|nr:hypothetical protein F4808DRAFT_417404 [Astrocystis sublimbata]
MHRKWRDRRVCAPLTAGLQLALCRLGLVGLGSGSLLGNDYVRLGTAPETWLLPTLTHAARVLPSVPLLRFPFSWSYSLIIVTINPETIQHNVSKSVDTLSHMAFCLLRAWLYSCVAFCLSAELSLVRSPSSISPVAC